MEGEKTQFPQTTDTVVMVTPDHFRFNPEAAKTNAHTEGSEDVKDLTDEEIQELDKKVKELALAESGELRGRLKHHGTQVVKIDNSGAPDTPDAVFPNNWFSTHRENGGTVVVYPMAVDNRRPERRPSDLIHMLTAYYGFQVKKVVDMTNLEKQGEALEGTGSLVLDRENKIAYACVSPRTTVGALEKFGKKMGYEIMSFDAIGTTTNHETGEVERKAVYHTNVVMSVCDGFAVICSKSIISHQREAVIKKLTETGHEIVDISEDQMNKFFAGNVLQIDGAEGKKMLVMSATARKCLTEGQLDIIRKHTDVIVASDLDTIERYGGGSARCMLAEVHLPSSDKRSGEDSEISWEMINEI